MLSELSVCKRVSLGYGTLFAVLLTAALTVDFTLGRIDPSSTVDEEVEGLIRSARVTVWVALVAGAGVAVFWAVHVSKHLARSLETASQTVTRCRGVAEHVSDTASRCVDGTEAVREAGKAVDTIKEEIDRVVRHMLELGTRTRSISQRVDAIAQCAEQTTILSYNAAIEASSAGPAGRSFAVVAEQLSQVSEMARSAIEDVRKIVEDVQNSTNTTILATEEGLKAAELGVQTHKEAREKVYSITEGVQLAQLAAREIFVTTESGRGLP